MAKLSTIVYVEDSPADRKAFRDDVARYLDNEVIYLSAAEDLLARLQAESAERIDPGIILIDLVLPGMSGYELVVHIREAFKYLDLTPLIIVAGSYDDASKTTAKMAGADWYLGKPVTYFGLQDALKNIGFKVGIFDARSHG